MHRINNISVLKIKDGYKPTLETSDTMYLFSSP